MLSQWSIESSLAFQQMTLHSLFAHLAILRLVGLFSVAQHVMANSAGAPVRVVSRALLLIAILLWSGHLI